MPPAFRMTKFSCRPDPRWVRAARRQAEVIWIYVPGFCTWSRWCGLVHADEKNVRLIERAVNRYMDLDRGRIAYLCYQPTKFRQLHKRETEPVPLFPENYRRWSPICRAMAERLDILIFRLNGMFPIQRIGVIAEDFSARYLLWNRSRSRLDYLILDTPAVSLEEMRRHAIFKCPGVLRRSRWSLATPWRWEHAWRMPFPRDEAAFAPLEASRIPVGVWPYQIRPPWADSVFTLAEQARAGRAAP